MAIFYSGSVGGFFDTNLFDPETFVLPDDAVEVTGERHQQLLAEQGTGKRIVAAGDGHPITVDPEPGPLSEIKATLKAAIDAAAEAERLRYITPGAGQAMTYARKVEQAKAVLAAADPVPADYPMLAASIGIDGPDIVAVANVIVAMDAAWETIGAAIERARLNAKQAVDLAETAADARAVEAVWPSAG